MMVSFQLLSFDIYNKQLSNYLFSGTGGFPESTRDLVYGYLTVDTKVVKDAPSVTVTRAKGQNVRVSYLNTCL
jgi:hypothetical protein